jgi:hypothetical protein
MEIQIECKRCTSCCRWPGEVRLSDEEITAIAAFLGMTEDDFIARHTRVRADRQGLALIENPDHSCIFLEGNRCTIQPVKPEQCHDFPTGWVKRLWGKMPLDTMQRDYPMLFACSAFQDFLKSQRS